MTNNKIEEKRQAIADAIVNSFETNDKEWSKGWYALNSIPQNGKTGRYYNGANIFALIIQAENKNFADPRWVTFKQASDLNASVKTGEKATAVFHYNEYDVLTKKSPDWEEIKKLPKDEQIKYDIDNIRRSISYHNVFNAEQIIGMPAADLPKMNADELQNSNDIIEEIIKNSPVKIFYGGGKAHYDINNDNIRLPNITDFKTKQDYYSTALHEISHSTGHKSRLNRFDSQNGIDDYAIEELRATFASIFIQSELGIKIEGEHWENHGAYLKSWASFIKDDKDILFKTIKEASDIASFIQDNYIKLESEKQKAQDSRKFEEEKSYEHIDTGSALEYEMYENSIKDISSKHGMNKDKISGFLKASNQSSTVKPFALKKSKNISRNIEIED